MAVTYDRERATVDIMGMPIADGLKELLMNYELTRNDIVDYSIGDLADLLNIDEYVAKLIIDAAKYQIAEIAQSP